MYLGMKPQLIILFWIMFLLSKKKTFIIYYIFTCIKYSYMPITRMILPCFWFQSLGLVNNFLSCKHLVDFCKIATIYNKKLFIFHLKAGGHLTIKFQILVILMIEVVMVTVKWRTTRPFDLYRCILLLMFNYIHSQC